MTGWPCPNCGQSVVSLREWAAVFMHRDAIERRGPRTLADDLRSYNVEVRPEETAVEVCRRWASGDTHGPGYVCPSCVRPFERQEVAT